MRFLPIVERELRQLSRRAMTYHSRVFVGFAAAMITLGVLAIGLSTGSRPQHLGMMVFTSVTLLAFGGALLSGPLLTSDCISQEKRTGTLGLVFLTNVRGVDVITGKLVALALPAVHCMLAVFPIIGLSFLMGGVNGGEFLRVLLALAGTLFLSLSIAMFVSAICRDAARALAGSLLAVFLLTFGLPALSSMLGAGKLSVLTVASPLTILQLYPEFTYKSAAAIFWISLVVTQVLAWTALVLAGICLPNTWQDRPVGTRARGSKSVGPAAPPKLHEVAQRRHLLDSNPIKWLASRNKRRGWETWFVLIVFAACLPLLSLGARKTAFGTAIIFLVIYVLHAGLKISMAWEASRRFSEDRNSGALELLLCTPLTERAIWRGWLAHLKRRFLVPIIVLLAVDLFIFYDVLANSFWWTAGFGLGIPFVVGMGLLVADMYALSWVGLWQGLISRDATRACVKSIVYILALPAASCLGVLGMLTLGSTTGATIPLGAMTALWFGVGYITDAAACATVMTKMNEQFRAAAIYGMAPDQNRKSWAETLRTADPVDFAQPAMTVETK